MCHYSMALFSYVPFFMCAFMTELLVGPREGSGAEEANTVQGTSISMHNPASYGQLCLKCVFTGLLFPLLSVLYYIMNIDSQESNACIEKHTRVMYIKCLFSGCLLILMLALYFNPAPFNQVLGGPNNLNDPHLRVK